VNAKNFTQKKGQEQKTFRCHRSPDGVDFDLALFLDKELTL
jgi:hypothetical protein